VIRYKPSIRLKAYRDGELRSRRAGRAEDGGIRVCNARKQNEGVIHGRLSGKSTMAASLLQVRVLAGGSCDHSHFRGGTACIGRRQVSRCRVTWPVFSLSPSDGPSRTLVCLSSFVVLLCWPCWRRRLAPSASLSPSAAWPPRSGRFTAGAVLSARYCALP
jgi:hypothetical protein